MTARTPRRRRSGTRLLGAVGVAAAGLVLGLIVTRVLLDVLDSRPYDGQATETAYLLVMALSLGIAAAGVVTAVVWYRRGRRPRESDEPDEPDEPTRLIPPAA